MNEKLIGSDLKSIKQALIDYLVDKNKDPDDVQVTQKLMVAVLPYVILLNEEWTTMEIADC